MRGSVARRDCMARSCHPDAVAPQTGDPLANEFRNEQALECPFSRQPALVCDFKNGREAPLWLGARGEAIQPLFQRQKTLTFPEPKALS